MNNKSKIWAIALGVIATVILLLIPKFGEDVDNEKIVINQVPFTGTLEVWTTPGFKWQKFGKITEYYKTNQIEFNTFEKDESGNLSLTGDNPAYPITYSDKGKGIILGSVRIELPMDAEKLRLLQTHYGSERRLIEELIKPTVGKVIIACGPLMTSLESVSEKRNDLIYFITDQLNNGIYATRVKNVEVLNSVTQETQIIAMGHVIEDERAPGGKKRQEESPFLQYGLKVSQLSLKDLMYEPATDRQIAKQREADMEIITAKAESAKAVQNAIKAEKEGEAEAMKAKWEQEREKAVAVTKAQQEYEVAELEAKKAAQVALKVKAEGEAKAAANRALVAAGLTPLEKAEIEKETKIGVATALANYKGDWTPKVVGGGTGKGDAMDALGINMILQIIDKLDNK